jgi:hypothetical protein
VADRLRLLAEELRHSGPEPWLMIALEYLADELEYWDERRVVLSERH